MLKKNNQLELNFSKHIELYNILIKEDNFWRQLNELIDFSFVYEELKDNYEYGNASACGKIGITIQGATTLFLANMKRIIKLNEEKIKNID
jgi:hypothetical protein